MSQWYEESQYLFGLIDEYRDKTNGVCVRNRVIEILRAKWSNVLTRSFVSNQEKRRPETHGMLMQINDVEAASKKCVFERFKHFRDGKEGIEDDPRSGRPSTKITRPEKRMNLESAGFFLFLRIKLALKGFRFADVADFKHLVTMMLRAILQKALSLSKPLQPLPEVYSN
ncbi:hypothetical protein C0J52_24627 [Blattella germanica]|nr:hypothetical protein C0J52_24627 [Blattella germanica]